MKKALTVGSLKQKAMIEASKGTSHVVQKPRYKAKLGTTIKHKLYFIQNGRSCAVPMNKGATVLNTALEHGCELNFKCKKGTCGKCAIKVLKGMDILTSPNTAEQIKLGSSLRSGHRLSCQAQIK